MTSLVQQRAGADIERMQALCSPARQEILDTLQILGPCSISQIAAHLGRPADSLYYHVRKLGEVGLLRESGTRRARRREEVLYDLPAKPPETPSPDEDFDSRAAVIKSTAAMLRLTERTFREAYDRGLTNSQGPGRNVCADRVKGWVTSEDLLEIRRLMERIHEIVAAEPTARGDAELVSVSQVLTPVLARQVTRARGSAGNGASDD